MTKSLPDLCYLCGTKLTKPISHDHVPMRQLWTRELRRDLAPQLLTIPVHKSCNSIYQQDEDYFIQSIVPFVPQSHAGNALFRKIVAEYHSVSYRFRSFPEVNNLHYWALLILDRIIVIVIFHDLACTCINCTPHSGTNDAASEKADAPTILQ